MEERFLFPGKGTRLVLSLMHMDASGLAMFCFDQTLGWFGRVIFSEAEQSLFSTFKDEHGIHIRLT